MEGTNEKDDSERGRWRQRCRAPVRPGDWKLSGRVATWRPPRRLELCAYGNVDARRADLCDSDAVMRRRGQRVTEAKATRRRRREGEGDSRVGHHMTRQCVSVASPKPRGDV